ncbi:zf-CGNR multi-domain protein [Arthrobacter sp. S39]|nr:zf-CGNR multi-domain protein [Arthrobacter sp. S39]
MRNTRLVLTDSANRYHENMSLLLSHAELMPPAPGEDVHPSLALANSAGRQDDPKEGDLLRTPERATQWMIERNLAAPDVELYDYCSNRLREFRRAVRGVLGVAATGASPDEQAIAAINDAMMQIPSVTLLAWDGQRGFHARQKYAETQAVEQALSTIAADVLNLVTGEAAAMLTQCAAPSCGRFMLRTHARRQWCSTRCGDRVRAARAYAKKNSRTLT